MEPYNLKPIYFHFKHSKCYTHFRIMGDFNPITISEILELKPEKFWKMGDKRKNGTTYSFSSWNFGNCNDYDITVSNQIIKTITPLLSKIEKLKEIKKMFNVNFALIIVPYVRFDETIPDLSPSKEIIKFCYETDTDLVIDLYVSAPDSLHNNVWEE